MENTARLLAIVFSGLS